MSTPGIDVFIISIKNLNHITDSYTYSSNISDNRRSSHCRATPDSRDTTSRSSRYPPQTAGWAPNPILSATLLSRWHSGRHVQVVESTDIVCLSHLDLMEDDVDGAGVIHYIQPVAHVLTLAIHRQRFAVADIVDEQWDESSTELHTPRR